MEVIQTQYLTQYEEYKKYILERDEVKRKASQYQFEYLRVFGSLVKEIFAIKIECISLKKKITYCQMKSNNNEPIHSNELESYISSIMKDYYKELDDLVEDVEAASKGEPITQEEMQAIKKIYRRIAKKIHPDMNPELYNNNEQVQELWQRCVAAYQCNYKKELEEIEVLVNALVKDSTTTIEIEDLDDKIQALKQEIEDIKNKNPYQYKYILDSYISQKEYEQQLLNEKQEYEEYQKQLQTILDSFDIQKVMS